MKTRLVYITIGVSLLGACVAPDKPDLPPLARLGPPQADASGAADLSSTRLRALYVLPAESAPGHKRGIVSENQRLALVDLVAVMTDDGRLVINDVLHQDKPPVYRRHKIDKEDIELRSKQGVFEGRRRLFTPSPDVLAALDTGYEVEVQIGPLAERIVFRPVYDADRYHPYEREGAAGPVGDLGAMGAGGAQGDKGDDGDDGSDGSYGENGASGENGESGGGGSAGSAASRGGDGGAADPGPDLDVTVRPIYSKFYPDEELVYVEVLARYHTNDTSKKNYIFHGGQAFRITTVGGQGGAGGDGGRGGDGGNGGDGGEGGDGGDGSDCASDGSCGDGGDGGNGGDGGDGADGGPGGNGGNGGDGGDGGDIRVHLYGDRSFQQQVRRQLRFASVPGEGGAGGCAGAGGNNGGRGRGGDGGQGGRGGSCPGGTSCSDGQDGDDGRDGDDGQDGAWAQRGRPGHAGYAGTIPW